VARKLIYAGNKRVQRDANVTSRKDTQMAGETTKILQLGFEDLNPAAGTVTVIASVRVSKGDGVQVITVVMPDTPTPISQLTLADVEAAAVVKAAYPA